MITVESTVRPAVIKSFCQRNGGSGDFSALTASQGAAGKTKQEKQSSWLITKGGSGLTLNDQWGTYLATKGYTVGSLKERMRAFFLNGTQS